MFDPYSVAGTLSYLASLALMVLGVWRSVQMAGGFVDRVYRSKALWMAALMSSIIVATLSSFVPLPSTVWGGLVAYSPLILVIVVSYAFVDRTILVAMKTDFFHRDVIGWTKTRLPGLVLLTAAACLGVAGFAFTATTSTATPLWATLGFYVFVVVVPLVLGYAAVAIVISGRRTADKTLKRHILLLGSSLACFAGLLALFGAPNSGPTSLIIDLLNVVSLYILYRAVMSLTSLGRVDKGAWSAQLPPTARLA